MAGDKSLGDYASIAGDKRLGVRFHSVPLGLAAVWGMLSKSQQPPLNVDAGDSRMHVSAPWSVAVDVGGNKGTRLRLNDKRGWRC